MVQLSREVPVFPVYYGLARSTITGLVIKASSHGEACFCLKLGLKWRAHIHVQWGVLHDRDSNPGFHNWEPRVLPLSYTAIPSQSLISHISCKWQNMSVHFSSSWIHWFSSPSHLRDILYLQFSFQCPLNFHLLSSGAHIVVYYLWIFKLLLCNKLPIDKCSDISSVVLWF